MEIFSVSIFGKDLLMKNAGSGSVNRYPIVYGLRHVFNGKRVEVEEEDADENKI